MSKRKTGKEYHELAESRGFKWLGSFPKNTHIKTWWECDKKHKWETAYHCIQGGSGCPFCSGHAGKTKKDYYELAENRGFKWVGKILPINISTKTWWQCNKKHKWEAPYNNIKYGSGCPVCNKHVLKIKEDYYNLAKSRGFKWVSNKLPKNINVKTLWRCGKGHQWEAQYSSIQRGSGCPVCYGNNKKTKKQYHKLAESRGFKWVDGVLPKDIKDPTWWECKKKHKFKMRYNNIQQYQNCPICSGKARKTEKDYHSLAKKRGFTWVGSFPKNIHTKTWWECKKEHRWKATHGSIQQGSNCPVCKDMVNGVFVSKPQIKLNNLLYGSLNYPEARYRIDVAIMRRSQKIAVEYDCWYWHQGKEKQESKRDKFLISRGWKVLHVRSGEMLPTRKQINIVINYLVDTNNTLYNMYLKDWNSDIRPV